VNNRLRRHARLIAGSLALVLAAGVAFVLHSAGSAHAQPSRSLARIHLIAPVLASASQRRAARVASAAASSGSARHTGVVARNRSAAASARSPRRGLPTPPPSPRTVSSALQKLTGLSVAQVSSRAVCPRAVPGRATCAAQALVLRSSGALVRPRVVRYSALGRVRPGSAHGATPATNVAAAAPPQPGTPAYLQQAYDLSYLSETGGSNDTVAIVDAYDDPSAEQDLAAYRSFFGLPACTTGNGCFQKVGQDGTSSLPAANPDWQQEIALDLDSVSAICPRCKILLVEADSSRFPDLEAGMETAAARANQISASWFGTSPSVPSEFRTFSGVATVAATGDYGYPGASQDNYPAALPGVTAAGGTSLAAAASPGARGFGESAWSWNGLNGGGSGCDLQFQRPGYQPAVGCLGRAYADVSADANPQTGLAVYNQGSWTVVGGTSLSTPLIAAYYAITGVARTTPEANAEWAYGKAGALNDVVSGSTGNCAASISYICNAGNGYDGPTGVGSISGSVVTGAPGIDGPAISSGSGNTGNTYTQGVAAHEATIAAGIYRNGLDTTWWIDYGISTSYTNHTAPRDIGAGSTPEAVTGYLSQLAPSTTYHYRVVAQNSLGTTEGYDYTFTTPAAPAGAPTAAFAVTSGPPGPGDTVNFDASASTPQSGGSITDYSWQFGDGSTADGATASHSYAARGTYTVTLTVTSDNGQTDTSTQTVTVDTPPTAAFNTLRTAVPEGTTLAFDGSASTASSGGSLTDYSWGFGDGSTVDRGADATASHTFTTPGIYPVSLTTTDDLDVSNMTTRSITVASFAISQPIPAPGKVVTFTADNPPDACGTVTGYTWDFGDNTTPENTTGPTVDHIYTARNPYSVSLTYQCSGTAVPPSVATVNVDTPPTVSFTASPSAFVPGTTVSFDASGSSPDTGGTITDYAWSFGDGSQVLHTSTPTVGHAFNTAGTYAVTLTITDELGATNTSSPQQVTADQPTADFTVSSSNPAPNSPVTFDASASSDPESPIIDYTWDFGNGPVDAGASPITTHSFSAAGTYRVKLTIKDQLGFIDTTTQQVVIAPPVAGSSNPPTTSPPAPTPTTPTTPTPVSPAPPSPPVATTPAPIALAAQLSSAGRQRLAQVLAHGIRLGLTVNRRTPAIFQITIPLAQTKQGSSGKGHPNGTVVLLRRAQTLAVGKQTIVLRLSRAAARRLALKGPLVLTVRVTLGGKVTRTAKVILTR
jgi:PKD repeat protein